MYIQYISKYTASMSLYCHLLLSAQQMYILHFSVHKLPSLHYRYPTTSRWPLYMVHTTMRPCWSLEVSLQCCSFHLTTSTEPSWAARLWFIVKLLGAARPLPLGLAPAQHERYVRTYVRCVVDHCTGSNTSYNHTYPNTTRNPKWINLHYGRSKIAYRLYQTATSLLLNGIKVNIGRHTYAST